MKLQTITRLADKKSESKKLRREGFIPAILYVKEKEGENIAIPSSEFSAHLRKLRQGHLPNTIFTLVDEKGTERRAIVKEIQYKPTTYDVLHLDFEELIADKPINLKVPIECVGALECPGVKLGGVLRQVIRHLRISCLPKDIPELFDLDVTSLSMNQSKRLSDLSIPNTIKPIGDLKQVAAVIVKR